MCFSNPIPSSHYLKLSLDVLQRPVHFPFRIPSHHSPHPLRLSGSALFAVNKGMFKLVDMAERDSFSDDEGVTRNGRSTTPMLGSTTACLYAMTTPTGSTATDFCYTCERCHNASDSYGACPKVEPEGEERY